MYLEISFIGCVFFWAITVCDIHKDYSVVMDYYQQIQTQILELNQNLRDLSQGLEFYFEEHSQFQTLHN